jgi:hypothetical protein
MSKADSHALAYSSIILANKVLKTLPSFEVQTLSEQIELEDAVDVQVRSRTPTDLTLVIQQES